MVGSNVASLTKYHSDRGARGAVRERGYTSMVKTETAFLDLKEASQFLGVSEATMLQLALEGTLSITTPPRSGIAILFLREDLLQFAEPNSEP